VECSKAADIIGRFCESPAGGTESRDLQQHLRECRRCHDLIAGVEKRLSAEKPRSECAGMPEDVFAVVSKIINHFT
jgi:hypothetical protein